MTSTADAIVARELAAYRAARGCADNALAWRSLERAHVVSQARLALHGRVHCHMLGFALAQRDAREAAGQLFRLLLVPLGHATGRLPPGNSGRANVSAFIPMPLPPDLAAELDIGPPSTPR